MEEKQTRLEVAQKLINMELNETIARWAVVAIFKRRFA